MIKRRFSLAALMAAPILAFAGALSLLALPAVQAQQQGTATPSRCMTGLHKSVDPGSVQSGDTARVTMIMTHTCPAERKPVDLVFLVDVSTSMTRGQPGRGDDGGGEDPGDPGIKTPAPPAPDPPKPDPFAGQLSMAWDHLVGIAPDQDEPPPSPGDPGNDPGITNPRRPGSEPPGCETNDAAGGPGVIPPIGILTPTPPGPQPPPGIGDPPPGGPGIGDPTPDPGAGDPRNPGNTEVGGSEDLIREAQRWLRRFVDEPEIQADMASGKLRLGLVAFNTRGRRLLSLTDDSRRAVSRLGLLRGTDKTRIDIGLRAAESAFREQARGGLIVRDDDRVKVIALISDGQFCSRDVSRARVDREIKVVAIAAGRGADQRKLREVSTEKQNMLILRDHDIKALIGLYSDPRNPDAIRQFDPVDMTQLTVRDTLSDTVELVPGSVNPAPDSINGRTIEWILPDPSSPVTFTFDVRPLRPGLHPVSESSQAEWKDTLGRENTADFPEVELELVP